MLAELRFAARRLRKSTSFTLATVFTLALAIGANCIIFSILNTVLLKPLAFDPAGRLVSIYERTPQGQREYVRQPDFDDWRAMSHSFSGLASWVPQSVTVKTADGPERATGLFVSANFFSVLGIAPILGRGFAPGEDRPGGARIALIASDFWRSHFGGDPGILGKTEDFNGEPYTIVGVLPPSFIFPQADSAIYLPAFKYPNYSLSRAQTSCAVVGKLRPGVSLAAAQAEMDAVAARLAAAYPDTNRARGITVAGFRDDLFSRRKPVIRALAVAVAFVLLIACANIAGLMIARMLARRRERAVRVALGAGRADLFGDLFAEAAILAAAGGALGLLLAVWAIPPIAVAIAVFLPQGITVQLDGFSLVFTLSISLAVAFAISAIPASQSTLEGLRTSRGAGGGASGNRVRGILVSAEIALALVLLSGAGLTVRSLQALARVEPGFDTTNLAMLAYRIPRAKYASGEQQADFHRQVIENIEAVPGVIGATSVRAVPLGDNGSYADFSLAGSPAPDPANNPRALMNFADPNFFATLRIPILRGRVFTPHDRPGAPYVLVINRTLAHRFFPDRDPIGQKLRLPELHETGEIVGVVGDVKHFRLDELPEPQIYGSLDQNPFVFTSVAYRAAGDPLKLAPAIRRAIWNVDKDQPVWSIYSFAEVLHNQRNGIFQLLAVTLSAYALLALLLAAIGIFGLTSYAVSQRTDEIGIRMALGARPADVAKLVAKQGAVLVVCGLGCGALAAAWLSRFMRAQLYAVSPLDPAVYTAGALLLAAAAAAAAIPAVRRALSVDPARALRTE